MRPVTALVVDDDGAPREHLKGLLAGRPEIERVFAAGSCAAAVDFVEQQQPDIMFLDIELPDGTGFDVLRTIDDHLLPMVVFVTAYDAHAVEAFERGAIDYLLKPFPDERFEVALTRLLERLRQEEQQAMAQRLRSLLASTSADGPRAATTVDVGRSRKIALKESGRTVLVPLDGIDWIEGADVYVRVHTRDQSYLIREKLESLAEQLDSRRFIRVHRSAIVNFERVRSIERDPRGRNQVVLESGAEIRVSRTGKRRLSERLELL
jgi:two-component system LytT family response regulator